MRRQCELLGISHSSLYTKPAAPDEEKRLLLEMLMARLDYWHTMLLALGSRGPRVVVAYFQPDAKKDGGAYRTAMGRVRGVLADRGLLVLEDGTTIPLEQVTELQEESPAL